MIPENYCREVERYLCQKNQGHLIRIVGPAFEQVSGWAAQGIPLSVVYRGIDRSVERRRARSQRRRPVRIEFCEADVLDVFDEWRRATGVSLASRSGPDIEGDRDDTGASGPLRSSLYAHLERIVARLTSLRAVSSLPAGFDDVIDRAARELDVLKADARRARGERRDTLLRRLAGIDAELVSAAERASDAATMQDIHQRALIELEPFRSRMNQDGFQQSVRAAATRLLRDRLGLPQITP